MPQCPLPSSFRHGLITSCVQASESLFLFHLQPPPFFSLSSLPQRLEVGVGGQGGTTWAPFLCSAPLSSLNSLFLALPRNWGLPGPHRGVLSCSSHPRPIAATPSACWAVWVHAQAPPPPSSAHPYPPHPSPSRAESRSRVSPGGAQGVPEERLQWGLEGCLLRIHSFYK